MKVVKWKTIVFFLSLFYICTFCVNRQEKKKKMKKLQTGCPIFFSLAVPLFHLFRNILKESCCHCAASSYLPLCLQLPFSTIAISISFIFLLIYLFNCHIYFLSYFCSIAIYIYIYFIFLLRPLFYLFVCASYLQLPWKKGKSQMSRLRRQV